MDFADACIVAMTEQITDCLVLTLDRRRAPSGTEKRNKKL
jgi:hypothetical protein